MLLAREKGRKKGKAMNIQLSEHFGYKKLLRFTLPSIATMLFSGIYGSADGIFISNFAGELPFVSVNLIYPVLFLLSSFGFMFGSGGSALVAKTMGEGDRDKANRIFSLLVYVSILFSAVLAVVGILLLPHVAKILSENPQVQSLCVTYGTIILCALPASVLQFEFNYFFITAERPYLGLFFAMAAGLTNILLDALFVAVFRLGVVGAAIATVCGQVVGGVLPLFYFLRKTSVLCLTKTGMDEKSLFKTCANGSSEFMTNVSYSVVTILYNAQLQTLAGETGVNSYAAISCVAFIFLAIFLGYSSGVAPVVSFHFGANHTDELHGLYKRSLWITGGTSVFLYLFSLALAHPLSAVFAAGNQAMHEMTVHGFLLYAVSFLLAGFNIFASAFFTALNDGGVSAIIAFSRMLFFQVLFVLVLPVFWGLNGVWLSVVFAEASSLALSLFFLLFKQKKYRY